MSCTFYSVQRDGRTVYDELEMTVVQSVETVAELACRK
jgi:hypothetical protein